MKLSDNRIVTTFRKCDEHTGEYLTLAIKDSPYIHLTKEDVRKVAISFGLIEEDKHTPDIDVIY